MAYLYNYNRLNERDSGSEISYFTELYVHCTGGGHCLAEYTIGDGTGLASTFSNCELYSGKRIPRGDGGGVNETSGGGSKSAQECRADPLRVSGRALFWHDYVCEKCPGVISHTRAG